jgi:hypothetical protein
LPTKTRAYLLVLDAVSLSTCDKEQEPIVLWWASASRAELIQAHYSHSLSSSLRALDKDRFDTQPHTYLALSITGT